MNLATLSVKRPVFITCIAAIITVLGGLSLKKMGVDLFPSVSFPVVVVHTVYPGAGPKEIENLVSKVIEDKMSTLSGINHITSINKEGFSIVIAEFTLETDVKYAEQQVRDRVAQTKPDLPKDAEEPIIQTVDPANQPILILGLAADLPDAELYDLADDRIRPQLEQVSKVGLVDILGGRKREIRVELDRHKLKKHEISVTAVAERISTAGQNIPAGKVDREGKELIFKTLGEFNNIEQIDSTIVSFFGNDIPVAVSQVGRVIDSVEDEKSRVFVNGQKGIFLMVYRQSGSNTVAVVDAVKRKVETINQDLATQKGKGKISAVYDGSKPIRANISDVRESILAGILLTILVVFFFLGNVRSTFITGLALPYSLIGAFILMGAAGFTVNIMTLLALSLAVGLVIDDAIVVRENIFRHMEMGKNPQTAAIEGTREVTLAVIATTATVMAVFGPIGFLEGIVGQFFKEFGLSVCFAMALSSLDAFTMAPMLSAYYTTRGKKANKTGWWSRFEKATAGRFDIFQDKLSLSYQQLLRNFITKRPFLTLVIGFGIAFLSIIPFQFVSKTFLPNQDHGEFMVTLDLPPGTSLEKANSFAQEIDSIFRKYPELDSSVLIVGNKDGESNVAKFFINLVPASQRQFNTFEVKEQFRKDLKSYAYANPQVKDIDPVGGGERPFMLNISGPDLESVEVLSQKLFDWLKNHPSLKDVDISSKPGKPELQISLNETKAQQLGVSSLLIGLELRAQVEGMVPAKFRNSGLEYDIRVRLKDDQRNLSQDFPKIFVPNINKRLIALSSVAKPVETVGPSTINRLNRMRYVQVSADMNPNGPGMAKVRNDTEDKIKEWGLAPGMNYRFMGQAEHFQELTESMAKAAFLGMIFIYLIMASLFESFIVPFTLMLVIPLAACGAFYALFITGKSLNIFSMIGCIMLLGVAMKNSILLVDYATQKMKEGMDRTEAIIEAGRIRLRPILMTTVALIAGMLPIALGLNEASRQRTSMGVAIIGGLITSTALSLLVVPAAFSYIDRFRVWSLNRVKNYFGYTSNL